MGLDQYDSLGEYCGLNTASDVFLILKENYYINTTIRIVKVKSNFTSLAHYTIDAH